MSKISVVAVDENAARLFSRQDGGIAMSDGIFSTMMDETFADRVAAWLEAKTAPPGLGHASHTDRPAATQLDRFVLLGTPRMLHALRQTIKSPVCASVIAEIHQDLGALSQTELKQELEKILWF